MVPTFKYVRTEIVCRELETINEFNRAPACFVDCNKPFLTRNFKPVLGTNKCINLFKRVKLLNDDKLGGNNSLLKVVDQSKVSLIFFGEELHKFFFSFIHTFFASFAFTLSALFFIALCGPLYKTINVFLRISR